jgi:asparagine synthase (glutamine-hydrolysing)
MCGILGFTSISGKLPTGTLSAGLAALVHRGPDQQGGFCTRHVALGATRLRVIDLAHGDQPMHSADRDVTIVFNGEIYNHADLRRELEARGRTFQTACDTEVVLHAFLQWGEASFARLRGMFGVAIWQESRRRLVLARDRLGIKPLYYCLHDGELYFGSELKCIFAQPEVPRRIDLDGLNCYLALNYVPGPFTLVEGIRKLMPGHILDWEQGRVTLSQFAPPSPRVSAPQSLEEACTELDELLQKAVKEQLVSDVPLGVWLSGGLDSSTILHYASQLGGRRLRTFSVTFRGKSFDESGYIREVCRHYGTDHTEFDLDESADLSDVIEDLGYYSDEPSADAGAVPVWYLAKMSRRDVTVVLSGEGSDELFGGYLTYKADRLRRAFRGLPRPLLKAALKCAWHVPVSDEKIGFDYKIKRFLQGSLLSSEAAHVFWNGTFDEDEKRRIFLYSDPNPLCSIFSQMQTGDSLERFMDFDRRFSLPDGILYKVDRMGMAHAVEVRPPFLDDRIVDFASRLPMRFKMTGSKTKVVLRTMMKDSLPPAVLRRPKVGFDIPIHEWFRGVLRPLLQETLTERTIEESGLFDWPGVERLIHEHVNRKANWGYHLWGLLTLILWMKRWKVEGPARELRAIPPRSEVFVEEPSLQWQPASYSARTS